MTKSERLSMEPHGPIEIDGEGVPVRGLTEIFGRLLTFKPSTEVVAVYIEDGQRAIRRIVVTNGSNVDEDVTWQVSDIARIYWRRTRDTHWWWTNVRCCLGFGVDVPESVQVRDGDSVIDVLQRIELLGEAQNKRLLGVGGEHDLIYKLARRATQMDKMMYSV
ncbi:MAG: hypothetical protein RLZZ26_344 [Candidatus Parcubacteria bacterium]